MDRVKGRPLKPQVIAAVEAAEVRIFLGSILSNPLAGWKADPLAVALFLMQAAAECESPLYDRGIYDADQRVSDDRPEIAGNNR
jgi:hypothetical protein